LAKEGNRLNPSVRDPSTQGDVRAKSGWRNRLSFYVVLAAAAVSLILPLHDITSHADRISILPSLQIDASTYDAIGLSLATTGDAKQIPVRQPPGFVVLLAAVYRVFGHSWLAAKYMIWGALVASTVLAAWVGRRVWGSDAGAVAALLTASSPALRHYAGTIQYEVVTAAGVIAVVALTVRALEGARTGATLGWAIGAGVSAGLLALTREVFLGVIPLVGVWLYLSLRSRRALFCVTIFFVTALAPVAAWSVFQSQTHSQVVLISDKAPLTFALGNNPEASGTYNVDRIVEPSGFQFFLQMPSAAARLAVRKALYFWGILRDGWNVPRPAALWLYRASGGLVPLEVLLPLARGGWLLIAMLTAVILLMRQKRTATGWILVAIVGLVLSAHIATLSSHRFAVPILPLVFVLISGPLTSAAGTGLTWMKSHRWRWGVALAALVTGIALQWSPQWVVIRYDPANLDAMNEVNRTDPLVSRPVRFVAHGRGRRTAMILTDEFLPAGTVTVAIEARREASDLAADKPVARVSLFELDGHVACDEDIPFGILRDDRFGNVWIPCRVNSEGPATLIVDSLGAVDLSFSALTLTIDSSRRP